MLPTKLVTSLSVGAAWLNIHAPSRLIRYSPERRRRFDRFAPCLEHTVAIVRANGLHPALSMGPRRQTRDFAPAFIEECMQSAIVGAKQSGTGVSLCS